MTILRMSVQSGAMILATALLRFLALDRAPKNTFLVLWGLVIARMLIPLSIPCALVPAGSRTVTGAVSAVPRLRAFWLTGMLLLLTVFSYGYIRSSRRFRDAVPFDCEAVRVWLSEQWFYRPVRVLQSERTAVPLAAGLIRPKIIFPPSMVDEQTEHLRFILEHESVHIRRLDILWKLLALTAVCVHWFNPLAWVMLTLFNRDLEITCDEQVLRRFGNGRAVRKSYALSLIEMEEKKNQTVFTDNAFAKNVTEERVATIVKRKKTLTWAVIASLTVITITVLAFAANGTARVPEPNGLTNSTHSIYGRVSQCDSSGSVVGVETLNVQTEGGRVIDWTISEHGFRVNANTTTVIDASGEAIPRESIYNARTVTVWFDPNDAGSEAPLLTKASAVRVDTVWTD